jgi:hypothetical protein
MTDARIPQDLWPLVQIWAKKQPDLKRNTELYRTDDECDYRLYKLWMKAGNPTDE